MKRQSALACVVVITTIVVAAVGGCVSPLGSQAPSSTESTVAVALDNPWVTKAETYQGALHAHSNRSDGELSPQQLTEAYARQGFSFVFITDHDTITRSPAVRDVLLLPGQEDETCLVCPPRTDAERAGHIVALNVTSTIPKEPPQTAIRDINAQGGMAMLVHPMLPVSTTMGYSNATLRNLTGYRFIEVTNIDSTSALAFYDATVSSGKKVWLTGDDDAHSLATVNRSSVIVNADHLTGAAVVASLEAGNFYATTGGARISSIATHNSTITITVPTPSTITWIQHGGTVLKVTDDVTSDAYTARGDEQYVRIEVQRSTYAERAWSQPIFVATQPVNVTHAARSD